MITTKDILQLASLSRLEIPMAEAESLTPQIDSILGYVSQIESMNVREITDAPRLRNVLREDVALNTPSQYTEDLLSNAPAREGNYLKVKKIL